MSERQSKSTQDRHERILNELVKKPGNDHCADCGTKNPRWASHSLGVFLCIRCAGLHRKMGTHISKIKSITMDQWSTEQIEIMRNSGGNTAVNSIVNPTNQLIPITSEDDHSMEKFIRAKWEKRIFSAPKRVVQSVIQAPPKRSSSVPVYMHPKEDVFIPTPVIQQKSPVISQPTTDEQNIEELSKLGFSDRNSNMEALRRAGGNLEIAKTVLNEAKANIISAQHNPFSAANTVFAPQQKTNLGFDIQPQQQTSNMNYGSQPANGFDFQQTFSSQSLVNLTPQQPITPFNTQQSYISQQNHTNSPYTHQFSSNQSLVDDPFGLSTNHFSGTPFNNPPVFNPAFGNNTQAKNTIQYPTTTSNPFSQNNGPFNIQNQPFASQPFSNAMTANPWPAQTYMS